jgi:hypothetical protein
MARKRPPLTPTERQRRWRAKKRKAEVDAGLRPKQKRPKSAAEIKRAYRARLKRRRRPRNTLEVESGGRGHAPPRQFHRNFASAIVAKYFTILPRTAPPWENGAEWCYRWLGEFAARVLMPGRSLLCFTGNTTWFRDASIFAGRLQPRPLLHMPHTSEQPMPGEFARIGGRPVLWFTKGPRRNQLMVPTVIHGSKDKALHPWQQGDAVWQWIEPLTDPGDLVVDPFCGSGEWGHICGAMGRKWTGCDIEKGGSTRIVV